MNYFTTFKKYFTFIKEEKNFKDGKKILYM